MSKLLKQLGRYLPLLVLPLLLTGCSLKSSKTTAKAEQSLVIWRQPVNKKLDDQVFAAIIAAFKKKHPNIQVTYRSFEATEDYETEVLNALAAGQGPDIWEIRNDELPRHQDKLVSLPSSTAISTAEFKKKFASSIAEEMLSDGKLYGMPFGIDPLVLFMNKSHFEEANINDAPKTWEETIVVANTLTRKVDTTIFRPGLALGTASNVNHAGAIVELLMQQFETQMVDPGHRTATFDLYTQDPTGQSFNYPGQNAVQFYSGFANPASGYQVWDINQPYSTKAFADGTVSMIIDYLSVGAQIKEINPKLNFNLAYVPQRVARAFPQGDLPGSVSDPVYTARYRALVVSKPWAKLTADQQTAKQTLGWQFINETSGSELAATLNKKTWALSPTVPSVTEADASSIAGTTGPVSKPITPYIATWFKGPSPRSVDKIITEMTQAITEAGLPVAATLTQAAQIISGMLQ